MDFKRKSLFSVALLCVLCLTVPKAARADDFTFSFTAPVLIDGQPLGSPATGTVTGEIYGLTNNATSAATDVTITGVPTLFVSDPNLTLPTTDTFQSPRYLCCGGNPGVNTAWVVTDDMFTETGGAITSSSFSADAESQADDDGEFTFLDINSSGAGFGDTNLAGVTPYFTVSVPPGDITFTPVSTPEPSSLGLVLLGLGSLGLMLAIRKRKSPAQPATCGR